MKPYQTLTLYLNRIRGARIEYIDLGTKKQKGIFIPITGNASKDKDDYVLRCVMFKIKNKYFKRIKNIFKKVTGDGVMTSTHVIKQKQKQDFYDEENEPLGYINEYYYDDGTLDYSKYLESHKKKINEILK